MACTGFWPVKSRLKDVLLYAENPDKTTDRKYLDEDLWATLRYAENKDKTDQTMYVSGINCIPQRAYECMMETKKRFGKLGGNVAYHGFQSFKTGEVTPEEAHKIGMATARIMWGSEYEVLVTTHLNTDNLHNHFVVNSVSFKTGRKFENHIRDHVELRKISDEICKDHGKSVIPFTHFYGNKKAYWARKSGMTHRQMLQSDLDEALSECCSEGELYHYLERLGNKIVRDSDYVYISVIAEGWKRPLRISSLGEAYSKGNIRDRLEENRYKPDMGLFHPPEKKRTPLLEATKHIPLSVGEYTLLMTYEVQGIAMYFLSADPLFLSLGLLFAMDLPLTVTGRAEKRNTFSVVANWLIAFGGSVCFLTVRTIWFVVALLCNLVLLAVCIAILYKPWISWKQRQKQRKRELRKAQRMAGRKKQ